MNRCGDLVRPSDGSYRFEEFRRDPEDQLRWTPRQDFSHAIFDRDVAPTPRSTESSGYAKCATPRSS